MLRKLKKDSEKKERQAKLEKMKEVKTMSLAMIKKIEMNASTVKETTVDYKLVGNALLCLGPKNCFRMFLSKIKHHAQFENVVLGLICISTLLLTMEAPLSDPDSLKNNILGHINTVMTFSFILEFLIKIITHGFACNGPDSYILNAWNIMDFIIVMVSIFDFLPLDSDLNFFKVLRLMRVIRPLRMISRNPGMKIAIESLLKSIPGIGNLMLISLLVILMFSILGTTFYKGLFYVCNMDNVPAEEQDNIQTMWECMDYGGEWVNSDVNFDNVLQSILTFFTVITTEGWVTVMWAAVNSTEMHKIPVTNNSPAQSFFFIFYIVIGSLFIINLFVGVVISNFSMEKEKLVRNTLLTPLQMEYCNTMTKCFSA